MNFVAMDFETANHEKHSAVSMALAVVRQNEVVDEFYSLIQPETYLHSLLTLVHATPLFMVFVNKMLRRRQSFQKFGRRWRHYLPKTNLLWPITRRLTMGWCREHWRITGLKHRTICC